MAAVVLALAASLSWGVADFFGGLKSRSLGVLPVMLIAQTAGTAVIAVVVSAHAERPNGAAVLLAAPAALAGTLGIFAFYRGMAVGAMSIVAPIAGVSAVIPVAVGVLTGDRPSPLQALGIAFALLGVALAAREPGDSARTGRVAAGVGLALFAAAGFGLYFPVMYEAARVDVLWAVLVFRLTSTALVASAFLAVRPRLELRRSDVAATAAIGVLDTGATLLFAAAATSGLVSLVSVLASLYPVVTIVLARYVLEERVARVQRVGAAIALAGVVFISTG
ncbi:MAG: DMT family transporter [Actinobacteria bacterium]|nr:DMT family transporter [Actinomycetota bacterium]